MDKTIQFQNYADHTTYTYDFRTVGGFDDDADKKLYDIYIQNISLRKDSTSTEQKLTISSSFADRVKFNGYSPSVMVSLRTDSDYLFQSFEPIYVGCYRRIFNEPITFTFSGTMKESYMLLRIKERK